MLNKQQLVVKLHFFDTFFFVFSIFCFTENLNVLLNFVYLKYKNRKKNYGLFGLELKK